MKLADFYTDTNNFVNYSSEHYISILVVALFGVWFLYSGKYRWNEEQKWKNALTFAIVLYGVQLFKTFIRLYLGNFDIAEDLPLQLCNILPLLMIIGLSIKSRAFIAVIFFWILGGTAQANLTPTLYNVFPHYEAIRYWAIHTGLPILAIYTFYVLGYRFTIVDVVRSALSLNILAAVIYPLNMVLGANYLYLNGKPGEGTIYDLLGPWPWYLMSLEAVMLVIFSVVLIPFFIYARLHDNPAN